MHALLSSRTPAHPAVSSGSHRDPFEFDLHRPDPSDELSAMRDAVIRLRAEDERLLRLLELTPQQARLSIGPDGARDDRRCAAAAARRPEPVGRRL
jgi:hypothetical protein